MAKPQPTTDYATGGDVQPSDPVVYQDGCVLPISSLSNSDHRAALHALNMALTTIIDNDQA